MTEALKVPELVRQRAISNGVAGRRWLDDLPSAVAALAEQWSLEIGTSLSGGTAAFVTAATDLSGRACVLKVAMPPEIDGAETFRHSVLVHQLAGGRGCAELLRHDESMAAMLLERLGPNLDDLGMSIPQILETVTSTLRSFWQPLAQDCGLPTGAEKAAWLAKYITTSWEELDRPCGREVVNRATAYCEERARRPSIRRERYWYMATLTAGIPLMQAKARSSWSTPRDCVPSRPTISASRCANTTIRFLSATRRVWSDSERSFWQLCAMSIPNRCGSGASSSAFQLA